MTNDYSCDLHIHSCLSPCGDNDMTPANIAGMAVINNLNIVALTDHNTSKNCPAFFTQARRNGLIPVAGMELTTSEDVHIICLFRDLESAMDFDTFVEKKRILVKNKPSIFGDQFIMDENDAVIASEENLLINATSLSIEEAFEEVACRGGVAFPAHIDREANGIVAVLGTFPETPGFTAYELNDGHNDEAYRSRFQVLNGLKKVVSSDAHYLWNISEADFSITLSVDEYSSANVRNALIDYLLTGREN